MAKIEQLFVIPDSVRNNIDEISFPLSYALSRDKRDLFVRTADKIGPDIAHALDYKLSHNSAAAWTDVLGANRPLSIFMTMYDRHLHVETGRILTDGQAILHNYLRSNINYSEREKKGAVVRSGHCCLVDFYWDEAMTVFLIDSIHKNLLISRNNQEYFMVITLIERGFFVVGGDGYPVNISI